jgi:type II secretory pathway pseudopilin PulG
MKIQRNSTGFTLLEIIVASVVVATIMLGIVTSNLTLQKDTRDASNGFYIAATTQQTINQILKDASLMVGSLSQLGMTGENILNKNGSQTNTPGSTNFCFNQSDPAAPVYVCYTLTSNKIQRCGPSVNTCSGGTDLGTAKSITTTFTVNSTQTNGQQALFDVIIENCLDPAAASCCDPTDNTCNPSISNPYVKKEGIVQPSGQSVG